MIDSLRAIFLGQNDKVVLPRDVAEAERERHRVLPLRKTYNFRDVGGYAGANGRYTKWGILYRSDNLHNLHQTAFNNFNQLNLHTLIDLRSSYEKAEQPNRLPDAHTIKVVELPIFDRANATMMRSGELREKLKRGDVDDVDGFAMMQEANRQFVTEYNPEYRALLEAVIAAKGQPVLIHCTGGKDRTGFAIALILKILGADDDVIMADYLRSNELILRPLKRHLRVYSALRGKEAVKVVMQLARVETAYLGAAFEEINTLYGSFDTYLKDGLQLTLVDIQALQNGLLEKPVSR